HNLSDYVNGGGRLLVTLNAAGSADSGDYLLADLMGAHYAGAAPYAPDYLILSDALLDGIEPMEHACEMPGARLRVEAGTEVLAYSGAPYFNRTWQHFCSHQYTPFNTVSDDPVI